MRILFVEPAKPALAVAGEDAFIFEPLALEYVAAGVRDRHDVRILDMRLHRDLSGVLASFRPDVVGLTAYTVHLSVVRRLCARIKAWNPDVLTVVGGHHATVRPRDFLGGDVDVVVRGDGVAAFRKIVARFEEGRGFDDLPGGDGGPGGRIVSLNGGLPGPLDDDPLPARDLTAPDRRHYYSEWMRPLASIRTSRGCPFRCRFCAEWKVAGGRYLKRSPERIVEELAGIAEPYVFFADDESFVDAARMRRLAELIIASGLRKRYFAYARSDTVADNPDLFALWRSAGLARVFVGLESFRDDDLVALGKGAASRDNERAVRILQDLDLDIYASFIVRPDFDREDFAALRRYCRALDLQFASFAVLTPLPGTDLWEETRDRLLTDDTDYCDFIHTLLPTRLPIREFYAEFYGLYRSAVSPRNGLAFLRRYRWRDRWGFVLWARRAFRRLARMHLDYEGMAGAAGETGGAPGREGA